MITFKHKRHMHEGNGNAKIVIYYNISDIFLGTILLILVVFFIHDYLSHALVEPMATNAGVLNPAYEGQLNMKTPYKKP